jgi:hypothetical protein
MDSTDTTCGGTINLWPLQQTEFSDDIDGSAYLAKIHSNGLTADILSAKYQQLKQ